MDGRQILTSLVLCLALTSCATGPKNDDADGGGSANSDELALENENLGSSETTEAEDLNQDLAQEELEPESPAQDSADTTPPPEIIEEPVLDPGSEPTVAAQPEPVTPSSSNASVSDLRYTSSQGNGQVVIETTEPVTFRKREEPGKNQVIIEISNVTLPAKFKRPYNTKDFQQPIAAINAYQDSASTTARVVLQLREPSGVDVRQEGNKLFIAAGGLPAEVPAGEMTETSSASAPSESADADSENADSQSSVSNASGGGQPLPNSSMTSLNDINSPDMKFYGRPISLEVTDTPVRDVISLIAEHSGSNIIVDDGVRGNITLKLRQIPWDQAMLLVMRTKALGYVRQGTVLRVAPLAILQAETDEAKKVQDAQKNALPLRVKVIPISYAKSGDMVTQVTPFLSARGKAVADPRTGSLIITDIPESIDRATNLIRALDTPPLQVLIEGKVVEASDSFGRDYGIRWGASGKEFLLGGDNIRASPSLTVNPGSTATAGVLNLNIGEFEVFGNIDATLSLAERESQARVLSSPRIVTLNNEAATITQSTILQIPQTNIVSGVTSTTYTQQNIRLQLRVTPQITSEADVIMQVSIQRQFPANVGAGGAPPNINDRSAETKVMVRSGQTAVIGGIYQTDATTDQSGIPFLKNIPVLGYLFKDNRRSELKNELLLFLTPRILNADKGLVKEGTLQ